MVSNNVVYIYKTNEWVPYDPLIRSMSDKYLYVKDTQGLFHKIQGFTTRNHGLDGLRLGNLGGMIYIHFDKPSGSFDFKQATNEHLDAFNTVKPATITRLARNRFV